MNTVSHITHTSLPVLRGGNGTTQSGFPSDLQRILSVSWLAFSSKDVLSMRRIGNEVVVPFLLYPRGSVLSTLEGRLK